MEQILQAEHGFDDAAAGRKPCSHTREYTGAYERGLLFARARRWEVALVFGEACRCPKCQLVVSDVDEGICGCDPDGTAMEYGLEALYGPGDDPDEDCQFFAPSDLRRLCQEGVPIMSLEGECLNPQILVQ